MIGGALKSLIGALRGGRSDLEQLIGRIKVLEGRRDGLISAPPHIDDVVAWVAASIDAHADRFEQRATMYLNEDSWRKNGAWAVKNYARGFGLFRLPMTIPRGGAMGFSPYESDMTFTIDEPDTSALVWLLREELKTKVPALITRILPVAEAGIRSADRTRQL
ncbi:MAG: hypothetical protein RR101_14690, partial [Burkholderiaceae bacterium]